MEPTEVTRPHFFLMKDEYGTGYAHNEEGKDRLLKDIQQAEAWVEALYERLGEMGLY
jgi:hypothetical protein